MTELDKGWAIQQIDKFIHASDYVPSSHPNVGGTFQRDPDKVVAQHAHVVERILDRVSPGWRTELGPPPERRKWTPLRDAASRARAALEREDELREKLGDDAPQLDAGQLHPWVWEAARSYWNTGFFHQSVMQAAIRINAETQAKLGKRDTSEVALFNIAFSQDEPKPDSPRLRLMANDGSKTYDNLHRGARAFADGLYTAIRNPGVHDGGEIPEQAALEQLAAFSILARWVDQATVHTI